MTVPVGRASDELPAAEVDRATGSGGRAGADAARDRDRPAPAVEPERLARAALTRVAEPGRADVAAQVAGNGATAAWSALQDGCWPDGTAAPPDLLVRVAHTRPEDDLAELARLGGRLLCPGDAEWPGSLEDLAQLTRPDHAPPLALWVRGPLQLAESVRRSAAVVGSRASTAYGQYVAGELGAGLAECGCAVVSGGAYGIDGAAHRGALAVDGATVAVLACGVDVPYPRGHDQLFGRIAAEGLLLSEWPPGSTPMRHRFLVRNRTIAALTRGTVVVEAAVRSGALNTARLAAELLRPLMAVPGPVTSVMSAGCHLLLREAAVTLVTGAPQVLEVVGDMGSDLAPAEHGPERLRDALSGRDRVVLEAVPAQRPAGPARIAVAAGVVLPDVLAGLGSLQSAGLVEQLPGGWRLTAAARTGTRPAAPTASG